jgi:nickel-dependent lactate racemase
MTFAACGGSGLDLSGAEIDGLFSEALSRGLEAAGPGKVLIIPPDFTRFYSRAGFLTGIACRELGDRLGAVLPALGTHAALNPQELERMFPDTPLSFFQVHDWRRDVTELGRIEAEWIERVTEGAVRYDWPVQVNKLLTSGDFSLILSLGQVVPHEVVGMANHAKNIFVGTGGKEAIDKSHFAGAVYGMERMMGRTDTPVRAMFDEGMRRFGDRLPPILYALTVISGRGEEEAAASGKKPGSLAVRGLYVGFGRDCFEKAAALSRDVNVELLDEAPRKAVVYLEPEEFRSTWLGNKAVYRTRMAIAGGGELLILAPGLERFGEDRDLDALIRRHGYRPGRVIRERAARDEELGANLSAAAHLIHGSSEGRFTIRYCPGPGLSRGELESAGCQWGSLEEALSLYDVKTLRPGWNTAGGERIFFIPNPALGLWAERRRFNAPA